MKSKKVVLSLLIVILLSKLTWGTPLYTVAKSKRDIQRKVLAHAVPGDILVKPSDHVVIIQNLNYPDNNMLITNFNQIDVIHSAEGLNINDQSALYQVLHSTAKDVSSEINKYQLRRLSIKE